MSRDRILDCHCHGVLGDTTISWGIVARNILLLVLTLASALLLQEVYTISEWVMTWQRIFVILASFDVIPLSLLLVFVFVTVRLVGDGVSTLERYVRFEQTTRHAHGSDVILLDTQNEVDYQSPA